MKNPHHKVIAIVLCVLLSLSMAPKDTFAAIPSTPTGLTATFSADSNQINLSWNYSSGASYYYVYRSTSYYGSYTLANSVNYTGYQDTNISSDTTYYYKVQAYNNSGISSESPIVSATASYFSSDITARAIGANQINLSWSAVNSAAYYIVFRSNSLSGTYTNIATSSSTSYTDSYLSSGNTYYYKVQAINSSGSIIYYYSASSVTAISGNISNSSISSERLSGTNRYETSKAISQSGWNYSYYAVVVSGENYPDALCSAPLASKHNAPILLTTKDSLDTRTRDELLRLNVRSIFLIGGVNVISSSAEQAIRNMGITVTRIAGIDRYDTSLKVAQAIGGSTEAVIATGENYADALSIAPIAAMKTMPILLTPKNSLSYNLKQYLQSNISKTYVVGGTASISTGVLNQLPLPERLSGSNRYQTNIQIIKRFINELNMSSIYLATGQSFPDALAGSALASLSNSPLILVSSPLNQETNSFIQERRSYIGKVTAFGGTSVISNNLINNMTESTFNNTLTTPIGLSASDYGSGQIYLSWSPVSAATHYYVYRSTSYNGTYTVVTSVTSPWYTDSGLSMNTTYYYKVTAINNSGSSPNSVITSATTAYAYPSIPTGLSANAQNSSRIYLSWNNTPNATSYRIYRSISGGSYSYIMAVSSSDYTDTGLEPNTTYNYKILASNNYGSSSYSSEVSAKTAPAAPNLTAVADGTTAINLSWNSVTGANTYILYSATSADGTYSNIATVTAPTTSYAHTGRTEGTTYYYKVIARNSSGLAGDYSSVASATTVGSAPTAPTDLIATTTDGLIQIGLTWTAVSGATTYSVSRSTDDITYTEIEPDAATNSYTDSALSGNTVYYYKVQAKNASGTSPVSTVAQALTAPSMPSNLATNADSSTQITLSWDGVAGAVTYDVLWSSTVDGTYVYRANLPGTIFIDSGLTADTTYFYKVQAINSAGTKSPLSLSASDTTLP